MASNCRADPSQTPDLQSPNALRPRDLQKSNRYKSHLLTSRQDQAALDLSSSGDGWTMSHAATVETSEAPLEPDEDGYQAESSGRKKMENKIAESLYSYNSQNASQFIKNIHGRYVNQLGVVLGLSKSKNI